MRKIIATLCLLPTLAAAQTPLRPDSAVLVGHLPNGLTYYVRHNELPKGTADFYIAQRVGAILEEDNQDGLAHFLEHMAFNGTRSYPGKGVIDCMERHGVQWGPNLNAYTDLDETVYYMSNVPVSIADSALLVLHDWSGFISLEDNEIEKERGVIREEWRTGDGASRRFYFKHLANTMPGTRYAVRDIIGDTAVINNFAHEALRDYYHKWYRPDLQGIVVVGDVDVADIAGRIERLWGDVAAPVGAAKREYFDVPLPAAPIASVVSDKEATTTYFDIQYRYKPLADAERNTEEQAGRDLLSELVQSVFNTRMRDLTLTGAPFSSAYMSDRSLTPTLNCVSFGCYAKTGETGAAYDLLLREMERLRRYGVNADELERAATNLLKAYDDAYDERLKTPTGQLARQCYNDFLSRDVTLDIGYERGLAHRFVPSLDVASANAFVGEVFGRVPVTQVSAMSDDGGVLDSASYCQRLRALPGLDVEPYAQQQVRSELLREPPKPGKVKRWKDEPIHGARIATLSNGLRVLLKPTTLSDNEVKLLAVSRGGYSTLPKELAASASLAPSFTTAMGLGDFSITELQRVLTGRTANVMPVIEAYRDMVVGESSKADVETLLQLVHLTFAPHREDAGAFDALLARYESQLSASSKDPDSVFGDSVQVLTADHNAYRPVICTSSELRSLVDRERVLRAYNARFTSARGFDFVLVGSFDLAVVTPLLERYIGSLPVGSRATEAVDRGLYAPQRRVERVFEWPMQTRKTSLYVQLSRRRPYTRQLQTAYYMLGRLLMTRYDETIREDLGGSYGVGVSGTLSREPNAQATLRIQLDTDPALVDTVRSILRGELDTIATAGPRLDDMEKIATTLIKKRTEQLQGNALWVSLLGDYALYGTDDTHYSEMVRSITPSLIRDLARELRDEAWRLEVRMTGVSQ